MADAGRRGRTMITVGCDRATSLEALALAARFPDVHATVGLHPHEAKHGVDTHPRPVRRRRRRRPVAVGECGLDFHYDHSPATTSGRRSPQQIELAHQLDLPLVIHTREAWDDTFAILDAEGVPPRTVFHCFTGGPDEARPLPRPRGLRQLLRDRHVPRRPGRPRRRRPRARSTAHARRDRQPVPRPGPQPGQAQPAGLGAARRRLPGRRPRASCRGDRATTTAAARAWQRSVCFEGTEFLAFSASLGRCLSAGRLPRS